MRYLVRSDEPLFQAALVKYATLVLILFYGEPDLMGAIIGLLGRIAV